ncbi:hypothetical protein JOB18_021143 [Solea senegalensis]|uniref:Uncharacterized protein n=1 Tax=Solea senegalensis TaxID=28829 RepID=A0AAV6QLY3_SOLSE|nr:hypothetical protein JOB18_021143 [Solea senegalensis]
MSDKPQVELEDNGLLQWRILQQNAPGRLQWSPEKEPSFSIEQFSNHVFELCLRPLPFSLKLPIVSFRCQGNSKGIFPWISVDINAFAHQSLDLKLLSHKCHTIEILQDVLTVNLTGGGENEEEKDLSGLFTVFMRLTVEKWEMPSTPWGGILLSADKFHTQVAHV